MTVHFFTEDIDFQLENQEKVMKWVSKISTEYKANLFELNYIFCSDEHLLKINQEFLNHDFYTDIITFDNSETEDEIEGDIFISIDRVNENAKDLDSPFQKELHRVMAHGILHLIGFNDKTDPEKKLMREKEDACLSLLND